MRGLLFASRDHFSDNGCVSFASQAADGEDFFVEPRCQFPSKTVMYRAAEDKQKGCRV